MNTPDQMPDRMPSEVSDLLEEIMEAKRAKVESLGKYVVSKRAEAIKGRRESGIEDIWQEDEEYYEGLDQANSNGRSGSWSKSPTTTGGLTSVSAKATTRCTSFFNITRQFVDSAVSRMGDILLPAGDWNFAIKPTPVQDEPDVNNPDIAITIDQEQAQETSERAELKIRDWLVECSYHSEVRRVIEDSAKIGVGVLKGPFPKKTKSLRSITKGGVKALDLTISKNPASKRIDPWDLFPDPSCGNNIHNGSYIFERDRLSARQVKDLKGLPDYLSDQIDIVLDEGPNKRNYTEDGGRRSGEELGAMDAERYEVWYFNGLVSVDALCAMNTCMTDEEKTSKTTLPAVVTLINDTPIRAHINPLDSGNYPYDVMPWQPRSDSWAGIGVGRQGRVPQDMTNSACRALMDNAGLSSGPQLIIRRGAITPADGSWNITARKIWYATEQADTRSVSDAFFAVHIPMVQQEMMAIIKLAHEMMESATGMFFLLQGQQGAAPDTVGGMELLHRNASAFLRCKAKIFDERITEPHLRRYHEYLMIYGPDNCKGDMKVEAIGSTALVEREIQAMESMALLQLSVNPVFGLDPEKAMAEYLKSKRYIPEKWTLDPDKKKAVAEQAPMIPAIEVAKIRAAVDEKTLMSREKIAQATLDKEAEKIKVDMDRDNVYAQTMAERDSTTATIRIQELQIKRDLAMLEYSNKRDIALDQIKSELASTSMKLRVQKELAGVAKVENKSLRPEVPVSPQVITPPTEPPQHAEDGKAFEQ